MKLFQKNRKTDLKINWSNKQKQEVFNYLYKKFNFLVTDFGFELTVDTETDRYPGGPEYYLLKYTHYKIKRQIEVVIHRNSCSLYFYLKRLMDNQIPDYKDNDNVIIFKELEFLVDEDSVYEYLVGENEQIDKALEILQLAKPFWNGDQWFDRQSLNEKYFQKKGYDSGYKDAADIDMFKKTFHYLLTEKEFNIIYDDNALRPFEQGVGASLVYANEKLKLGFVFSIDRRDKIMNIYKFDTRKFDLEGYSYLNDDMIASTSIDENELLGIVAKINKEIEKSTAL